MSMLDMLTYTPRKKYCNTLIFSLDKIVRRKCSIIGRNLLKIPTECFKLNHWHIERYTLHSKIEVNFPIRSAYIAIFVVSSQLHVNYHWSIYNQFVLLPLCNWMSFNLHTIRMLILFSSECWAEWNNKLHILLKAAWDFFVNTGEINLFWLRNIFLFMIRQSPRHQN